MTAPQPPRPPLFVRPARASLPDWPGEEPGGPRRPAHSRFLLGQSVTRAGGRPRRMGRGRARWASRAHRLQTVEAKEGSGRRRTITKLEAAVTQLVNRAASGDQRATLLVFSMLHDDASRSKPPALERDRESDDLVVAEIVRRLSQPQE